MFCPTLFITVGCNSHGLSLFFKDVADARMCTCASKLVTAALLASNTLGRSGRIRAARHRKQVKLYGNIKGITMHAPTPFAVQLVIVADLVATKDAFFAVCHINDWEEVSSKQQQCRHASSYLAMLHNRPYGQLGDLRALLGAHAAV